MGLRDFLMGAKQFEEGANTYGEGAQKIRQNAAMDAFSTESPKLIETLRSDQATPQEKAAAGARWQQLDSQSGGQIKNHPFTEQIAKTLFPGSKSAAATSNLTTEQLSGLSSSDPNVVNTTLAGIIDPKLQQLAYKETNKKYNQDKRLTNTNENKVKDSAQQFGSKFEAIQKPYDEAVGALGAQIKVFNAHPTRQAAFELSERLIRAAGGGSNISDSKITHTEFEDLNSQAQALRNSLSNTPDGPLPPEIAKSYSDLANNTLKATTEKRSTLLANQARLLAAGSSDRLYRNGEKHAVIKTVEDNLGIKLNKTDNGIEIEKPKVVHSGESVDLVNQANQMKDPTERAKWIGYLNKLKTSGKVLSPEESQFLRNKMQGGQ